MSDNAAACENCRFGVRFESQLPPTYIAGDLPKTTAAVLCRRFPPPPAESPFRYAVPVTMAPRDWCGEFKHALDARGPDSFIERAP